MHTSRYIPSLVTHGNHGGYVNIRSAEVKIFASPGIDDGVLSSEDIFFGTLIALVLAFVFSFLQGKSPSSSNINK